MTERHPATGGQPDGGWYEVRVGGALSARWADWFDGLTISVERDGTTVLTGHLADQAALHGALQRVRDLGVPLLSVTRAESVESLTPIPDQG